MPAEYGKMISDIKANTPGIENVVISTHCQNDLGLSTANTISVCQSFLFLCLSWEDDQIALISCFIYSGGLCRCEAAGSDNQWHW